MSTGAGEAWEGTAQHSRGGKLQPDAHPGRAVSLLGKMFTHRTMSYFLCVQPGRGRVRRWSAQRAALAAALAWARVSVATEPVTVTCAGHSHPDLELRALSQTLHLLAGGDGSKHPAVPVPGWRGGRVAAVQRNRPEGRGLLKSERCPREPEGWTRGWQSLAGLFHSTNKGETSGSNLTKKCVKETRCYI